MAAVRLVAKLALVVGLAAILVAAVDTSAEARRSTKRAKAAKPAPSKIEAAKIKQTASVPLPIRAPRSALIEKRTTLTTAAHPLALGEQAVQPAGVMPTKEAPATPPFAAVDAVAASPVAAAPVGTVGTGAPAAEAAANAVPQRVAAVFEKHCARCHQSDRLVGRPAADGGIANILDLDAIARNPALVRAGAPDASPLYQQMVARQMPSDVLRDKAPGEAPTVAEIGAVRAWIKGLPEIPATCTARARITPAAIEETMQLWLAAIGPQRAATTRFVSLSHLANACASDAELAGYRQAVTKLFNSLSWSTKPVPVETIGEALVLMAVRLDDIGWTKEHWQILAQAAGGTARLPVDPEIGKAIGTEFPLLPADALAHAATSPAIYARLLGLPANIDDLAKILGIDLDDKREDRVVRRAVVGRSGITGGPRVIERYPTAKSVLWLTHDFGPDVDPAKVLDHPLLPWATASADALAKPPPEARQSRALFTLPNGLPAVMLFDAEGIAHARLENAAATATEPAETAVGSSASSGDADRPRTAGNTHTAPAIGIDCMRCHDTGVFPFKDELFHHLDAPAYAGNAIARDLARQIVFGEADLAKLLAQDRTAVRRAMVAARIDARIHVDGHDPVAGLVARYRRDLDIAAAAAEMHSDTAALRDRLERIARSSAASAALARQLLLGRLSRGAWDVLYASFTEAPVETAATPAAASVQTTQTVATLAPTALAAPQATASDVPSAPTVQPAEKATYDRALLPVAASGDLLLWPDRITYAAGRPVTLSVATGRACHLTVVNVDQAGKATVLFPNEFDRNNMIKPGAPVRIPAADAPYQFLLKRPGAESFVALCEVGEPVQAGIRPDFTRQNFTGLDDWEKFLDASVVAATEPRMPLDIGDDIDRRNGRQSKPRPPPTSAPLQARAAVTVTIVP